MHEHVERVSAQRAALIGLVGLAAAMGVGRFAFTPMLPLMQVHDAVSVAQGGYLAGANYAGYLLGALLCAASNPRPAAAARLGLAAVAVSTLGMALTPSIPAWFALRLIAGIASAFVLVGVSAWSLAALAVHRRAGSSGWVFSGVGIGIVLSGVVALAIGAAGLAAPLGWVLLGVAASAAAWFAGRWMSETAVPRTPAPAAAPRVLDLTAWRLIVCYGAFGFGYIVPATFLPAAARALIDDPAAFGWAWPVFGLAAAMSTVVAAAALGKVAPRRCWALAQLIMAAGVALPAVQMTVASLIASALCVGGTFMVVTMAGLQEARRVGGRSASRLMAAMTAAFATGQLAGPLTVTGAGSAAEAIRGPSLIAAVLLLVTGLALLPGAKTADRPNSTTSTARRPTWNR